MAQEPQITFLQPQEVRSMIISSERNFLIIDVRDYDYNGDGGHIAGSINFPVENFDNIESLDGLIERHLGEEIERVVLHCMLSQERGPHAARRLAERLSQLGRGRPKVCVLANGFSRWRQLYGADSSMCISG